MEITINSEEFIQELKVWRALGYTLTFALALTVFHFPALRDLIDKVKQEEAEDDNRRV